MVAFKKIALKTGTYHSPDGEVPVTVARLQHWRDEFARMKAARQVVPIAWDHAEQSDKANLQPMSLADYRRKRSAKDTIGHLVDFQLTQDGAELTLDVHDPDAAKSATNNSVFISPVISPTWRDGAANEYADCFTHVDFVNHPVDHSQGPFTRVDSPAGAGVATGTTEQPAIACALRMGLGSQLYTYGGRDIRMAAEEKDGRSQKPDGWVNEGGKVHPTFKKGSDRKIPKSRQKDKRAERKASGKVPAKKEKPKSRGTGKRSKGKKAVAKLSLGQRFLQTKGAIRMADELPETDMIPTDVAPDDENYDAIDEILDMLEELNIRLPEDTTDENLIDRLRTALHTAMAHREEAGVKEPDGDEAMPPALESTEEPPVPETSQAMSLASANAIGEQYRRSLSSRLTKLHKSGRCTDAELASRRTELGTTRMSLAASGRPVRCGLERWIASREVLPQGAVLNETQRLSLQQNIRPAAAAPETPERVKAVMDAIRW